MKKPTQMIVRRDARISKLPVGISVPVADHLVFAQENTHRYVIRMEISTTMNVRRDATISTKHFPVMKSQ